LGCVLEVRIFVEGWIRELGDYEVCWGWGKMWSRCIHTVPPKDTLKREEVNEKAFGTKEKRK